ncbi:hypothetical protein F5Y03DRAFT_389586 [Xylaria venustula]|nr:hypothetical protein F5Y03DRAFT_389586 [Xylaria venustula]
MADNDSGSPQDGDSQDFGADDKPRLTEEEKKQNHIASEQKRREAIRAGFDRLCDLVPGLEGYGRSEGHVLKETVLYIREQLRRRRDLVAAAEARGENVPDKLKEPLAILEKLEERDRLRGSSRDSETNDDDARREPIKSPGQINPDPMIPKVGSPDQMEDETSSRPRHMKKDKSTVWD